MQKILDSLGVENWTTGKNVSPGWINVKCPFCDDPSNHGGFSPGGAYSCWRCGTHSTTQALSLVANIPFQDAKSYLFERDRKQIKQEEVSKIEMKLPVSHELPERHRNYLKKRGYDPDEIIEKYHVRGTMHYEPYPARIIIPIYSEGNLISWIGRDITGKAELRYVTPTGSQHKKFLYGTPAGDVAIVVEGIFDKWKMGDEAVALFGTGFTRDQILLLNKFKKVYIMLDADAKKTAEKLALSLLVKSEIIQLDKGDPGDLSLEETIAIKKDLLL